MHIRESITLTYNTVPGVVDCVGMNVSYMNQYQSVPCQLHKLMYVVFCLKCLDVNVWITNTVMVFAVFIK